jgi:hypothetical protein
VVAHAVVFPCMEVISWIVKHSYLKSRYIINTKGQPVGAFQPLTMTSYYHLEEGENILDDNLVKNFLHNHRNLLKDWYKYGNNFKTRTSNKYPRNIVKRVDIISRH